MKLAAIWAGAIAAAYGALPMVSQSTGRNTQADPVIQATAEVREETVREIDDPNTGFRWLLLRDSTKPAGPGRLVPVAGPTRSGSGSVGGAEHPAATDCPIIHAGDALIVEEHSLVVDARFEAVSLACAVAGAEFKARLQIGGKVVRVVAIAAGRAALAAESKAQ
jgi:hypothetical protein